MMRVSDTHLIAIVLNDRDHILNDPMNDRSHPVGTTTKSLSFSLITCL